jgi:FkbM family methyltransferase
MLIPVSAVEKYWNVHPGKTVHVGAHEAEELIEYEKFGWGPVLWIEAQPEKYQALKNRPISTNHRFINAAVWDVSDVNLELKVMTNSQSTSLFDLGTHSIEYPEIRLDHIVRVTTQTLNELIPDNETPDLIALDIQGAELKALQGFGARLNNVKWIYCEVNKRELYKGCCLVDEIDSYLANYGFTRRTTRWKRSGWGDALYSAGNRTPIQNLKQYLTWHICQWGWYAREFIASNLHRMKSSLKARI